jgi:hypothetical protein
MRDPLGLDADLLDSLSGLAWVVDADLRIRDYGRSNWRAFALANGSEEWGRDERVLGLHLFEAIAGPDVRAMYARMLADIFSARTNEVAFGFRCDAPERQRDMRMAITPVRRGGEIVAALFHSTLLAEEMRPPLNLYDFAHLDAALNAAEKLPVVGVCSLCQRVRPAGGHWMTAEHYYRGGHPARVSLSHGLCAVCEHQHGGETA